jgi:hypothetical protein
LADSERIGQISDIESDRIKRFVGIDWDGAEKVAKKCCWWSVEALNWWTREDERKERGEEPLEMFEPVERTRPDVNERSGRTTKKAMAAEHKSTGESGESPRS